MRANCVIKISWTGFTKNYKEKIVVVSQDNIKFLKQQQ